MLPGRRCPEPPPLYRIQEELRLSQPEGHRAVGFT
jgi:hypothetical protein